MPGKSITINGLPIPRKWDIVHLPYAQFFPMLACVAHHGQGKGLNAPHSGKLWSLTAKIRATDDRAERIRRLDHDFSTNL